MCFSASASFIASGAIGTVSVATLKKKPEKTALPFASIPLLFALQQFTEGILWLSFGNTLWLTITTYMYVFFAYVLWPIFTPWAIYSIEPLKERKKLLIPFIIIGGLVGLYLLSLIVMNPVHAIQQEHSIFYDVRPAYHEVIALLYLIGTAGSCLMSSEKIIKIFGFTLVVSFIATWIIYEKTFDSVWCFFSAILSVIVYFHFYFKGKKLNALQ